MRTPSIFTVVTCNRNCIHIKGKLVITLLFVTIGFHELQSSMKYIAEKSLKVLTKDHTPIFLILIIKQFINIDLYSHTSNVNFSIHCFLGG